MILLQIATQLINTATIIKLMKLPQPINDRYDFSGISCVRLDLHGDNKRINYVFLNSQVLFTTQKALHPFNLIPPNLNSLLHSNIYSVMRCRNDYPRNSFIPYVVREWSKLRTEICNSAS